MREHNGHTKGFLEHSFQKSQCFRHEQTHFKNMTKKRAGPRGNGVKVTHLFIRGPQTARSAPQKEEEEKKKHSQL